jgi:chemosensory pili system protein ChpA (sensor histidine kinase/response regulator)
MNAGTEFDVGPLTWVKSEIDLALGRADQALQQYTASVTAGMGDLTQIKFCRTHLHQVQGALTIVGLDGAKQFAEAVEALLEAIENLTRPAGESSIALVQNALEAIGNYLDDLITGQPNQPLRLLAQYREIQNARGISRVSPSDLFFPDLSVRPPRREKPTQKMPPATLQPFLRQERARFQRGFLSWLRNPQDRSGVSEMLSAVQRIEATQDAAAARSFWWVATGFLSALSEGTVPEVLDVKQLCARIDLQIRRLSEGSKNVAERLMRDALYFVANAETDNAAVRLVKNTYQLQDAVPAPETTSAAPKETVRRKLRDVITAAEEAWNKYCAGTTQSLHVFLEHAKALSGIVEQLGQTDYRRLVQAVAAAANWLSEDTSRHSEPLAMEIATAILLSQNAQENFQRLGSDFAHQVDVTVARIHGCIAGNPPQPGSEISLLDEMSRKAQEKLLIGQVAKEIQTNLAQIEQVLDGFFRDVSKRAELEGLDSPLRQIAGALTMMHHDAAVAALQDCAGEIKRFATPEYQPQEADFERVANQLSIIGFFIDSIQYGTLDYETFVKQTQVRPEPPEPQDDDEAPDLSVEQQVEQQKVEAHALLGALKEQPDDLGLRAELKQNLTALKNDADLVADTALGEQTKAILSALEAGDATPQIDQAMAVLRPQSLSAPKPSAETMLLSLASNEEIDAELLGIFLEEANEVLGTIDENLRALKGQPHNVELLTTLRRSFHTLKGSGRMVGLKDVGEAAWSIEQVLNLWLRQEIEISPPLLELLDQALDVFSAWVRHLEDHAESAPHPGPMVALAETLLKSAGEKEEIPALETSAPSPAEAVAALPAETMTPEPAPPAEEQTVYSAEIITPAFSSVESRALDSLAGEPDESTTPPAADAMNDAMNDAMADETAPEVAAIAELDATDMAPPSLEEQAAEAVSPSLYAIFAEEAGTHLATLDRYLPALESEEIAPTPHDMYRAAHTLASISAAVGIMPLNQLAHALENALLRRDLAAHPGSLEALGIIKQAISEIDLMLFTLAEDRALTPADALIEALDSLYPSQLVQPPHPADAEPAPAAAVESDASDAPTPAPAPLTSLFSSMPPLQDEIDEQLLPIFIEEALDLNLEIGKHLRAWREDPANSDVVRTLTRLLHTLKGSARMAGAMNLGQITHAIETHVEEASRSGSTPVARIDEIHNAFDDVLQIVERLQSGETLSDAGGQDNTALTGTTPADAAAETLPAPAPTQTLPHPERRSDRLRTADLEADAEPAQQRATLRVRAELIDRLVNEAGELSIARTRIEGEMRSLKDSLLDLTENVIRLRRQLRDIEIQAETQMQSRTAQADVQHAGFDPLEFDRFTRFQELTRMMAESVNDVGTVQQHLLKNLDAANAAILAQARLNREVQQELMAVRMVPFGTIADRLYRIVRQTTKELNKRANLEIKGNQVELDRSVLDKIGAPLEHLLRNAIAHGLEEREQRLALGKPDIGEISLALEREGNEIILSLSDDGAGLDLERIRARAIEAGLLGADENADPAQLANLIFTPGFSTASEISQVAGRGVGMDVVKTEVASLGGRVETLSTPGQGTEFRLYIPLTLAVTKALLVRTGNKSYAIPSVMIEQVLDLKEAALTRIRDAGSAEWMGHNYPFNFLPHLLGDTQALPEQHRQYWTLLLRSGNRRIAVQVDELMGNREIVVKNIGPQLARVIGVDGATVLGDGQVLLILNPVALSTRAPLAEFASPVPSAPVLTEEETALSRLPTVMVVDDSLTVRKITGRLLEREGYQVVLAKDGVDALEQLLDVLPDVMLVDIEMPRLDGFDLTRNIRADARLKNIPIIMITSRTADKHRSYAFEIGVNHYLGKPFQEDELLKRVAEYVSQQRISQ